jgi:hypothetical protein
MNRAKEIITFLSEDILPSVMNASAINKALDKLDKENSKILDDMIVAGRGNELPSDTLKKDDPLAQRFKDNYHQSSALRYEIERRYGPGAPSRLPVKFHSHRSKAHI